MKVISFFSFKGGVGRTSLMTNLGAYWASQGKVVLLMDLDLAAPGLSFSLPGRTLDPQGRGLGMSDLLLTFFEQLKEDPGKIQFIPPQHLIKEVVFDSDNVYFAGVQGNLFYIPAGQRHFSVDMGLENTEEGDEIIRPIPGEKPGLDEKPEQTASRALAFYLKEHLESWQVPEGPAKGKKIDYLLVDCRTGFAELLDLSLGYLADKMVLVSSLNDQNLKGLKLTLEALKTKRVPVDMFPLLATVVFSPLPASEDEQLFHRLEKAQELVAQTLRFKQAGRESAPWTFTIHYNQILATREALLILEHPKSLYARELTAIAHHLEGNLTADDYKDELLEKINRKVMKMISLPLPVPAQEIMPVKTPISENPLADLPPWYWPLPESAREESNRNSILTKLMPVNPIIQLDPDMMANHLSWSISISIDEKKKIMGSMPNLSQFQVDELMKLFEEERHKFMSIWTENSEQRDALLSLFFNHQRDWAIFILGDEAAGNRRFFYAPDEHIFRHWEKYWEYWFLLARGILENLHDEKKATEMAAKGIEVASDPKKMAFYLVQQFEDENIPVSFKKLLESFAYKLAAEEPWINYGLAYLRVKTSPLEKESAQELLEPLIQNPPENAGRCYRLGAFIVNHLPGIAPRAESLFRKAIELDENDAYPWNGLGNLLQDHLKRYEESESVYRKAIELDSKFAYPWNGLGNLLQDHLKRYEESESAYRKAIELDPNFVSPWNNLGNLLKTHLKKYEESEAAYRKAIELDENDAYPWNGLGNLLKDHLKRYEESESAYRKAIELDSNDAYPWNGLGNLLQDHLKRYEESESAYRKAIELDKNYASPWNGLGLLKRDAYQDCPGAIDTFKKGLDISKDNSIAYLKLNLGHTYLLLGNETICRDYLRQALDEFIQWFDYESNILFLALELNDMERVNKYLPLAEKESRSGDYYSSFSLLLYGLIYNKENCENYKKQAWLHMQSYDEHYGAISYFYRFSAFRAEVREEAARLAAELLEFSPELVEKFKDQPRPDSWYARFRPFAEGKSRGAGDPAHRHLFCKCAE
ncbi:MAG: tetratricopeptide repeat protein [Acidobacteria bacterium]|jgi:tetratricopeptide (TPR) repeat protein/MinD-like ATPase involved in chromosome partitioning or flagellar assembly|nr:tetratricopeptide repeat protein [Acidobacteriota bacterium]